GLLSYLNILYIVIVWEGGSNRIRRGGGNKSALSINFIFRVLDFIRYIFWSLSDSSPGAISTIICLRIPVNTQCNGGVIQFPSMSIFCWNVRVYNMGHMHDKCFVVSS
ncbi:unnamed protein product, partial [Owenia fusiformis]